MDKRSLVIAVAAAAALFTSSICVAADASDTHANKHHSAKQAKGKCAKKCKKGKHCKKACDKKHSKSHHKHHGKKHDKATKQENTQAGENTAAPKPTDASFQGNAADINSQSKAVTTPAAPQQQLPQ